MDHQAYPMLAPTLRHAGFFFRKIAKGGGGEIEIAVCEGGHTCVSM